MTCNGYKAGLGLEKCQMFHMLLIGVIVAPFKAKTRLGS
jgi:hypothetical protein